MKWMITTRKTLAQVRSHDSPVSSASSATDLTAGYGSIYQTKSPQAKLRRATDPVIQKGRASANLLLSLACPLLLLLGELECETGSPIDLNRVVLGTINEIVAGLAKDSDVRCETVF
jgi:hypothetical protein